MYERFICRNGCLGYPAPGPRPSYPALSPQPPASSNSFKLAPTPSTESPVIMIRLYGFMGYLNHVDLLMPYVYVLKKQSYCLLCA